MIVENIIITTLHPKLQDRRLLMVAQPVCVDIYLPQIGFKYTNHTFNVGNDFSILHHGSKIVK